MPECKDRVRVKFFSVSKKILVSLLFILGVCWMGAAQNFYWENPVTLTKTDSQFPITVSNNTGSYIFWQEIDSANRQIYLSCRKVEDLKNYTENLKFAGPFSYSGDDVPDIYTVDILDNGTVAVAAITGVSTISVFTTTNGGVSFTESKLKTSELMVAPRIYRTNANTFKLFTSLGESDSFQIYTADSKDGVTWSRLEIFAPAAPLRNPFVPVLIPYQNGDLVVFQAQYVAPDTGRFSYQLYATNRSSSNGNWSNAILISDQNSFDARSSRDFYKYQNQRASLFQFNDETWIAWERTQAITSNLWVGRITKDGFVPGSAEELTSQGNASRPSFFNYNDKLYITWFDTRRGRESVYMAKKEGSYWSEESLVENSSSNMFVRPLFVEGKEGAESKILTFVFQQISRNNKNTIGMLHPDKSVDKPTFTPLSYKKGKRSKSTNVKIQINIPKDSSGIKAYSYNWSRNKNDAAPKSPMVIVKPGENSKKQNFKADGDDGPYYFIARVQDYAGNWSESAAEEYYLDTTPPAAPEILFDNCDSLGILNSNSFKLQWKKSEDTDTAGYIYKFEYISDIPKNLADSKRHPCKLSQEQKKEAVDKLKLRYEKAAARKKSLGSKIITTNLSSSRYYNYSNGVYALYICAVDEVGNVGQINSGMFIINKFEPSTYITSVEVSADELGGDLLTIHGGGFTYDGIIDRIIIDQDGAEPYDLVLERSKNQFRVQNNTLITNVKLDTDMEEGSYRIYLHHTDRGTYRTGNIFKLENRGMVKIEADYVTPPRYSQDFVRYKYTITVYVVLIVLILLLGAIVILIILNQLNKSVVDSAITEYEIKSVIAGKIMPMKKIETKLKRQPSLKNKLIVFTFLIIVVSVLIVAIQNGYRSVALQEQTMAEGLQNRVEVLMESLHSGVKNFLPSNNILELSALPEQKDAMPEAKYVTIIGQSQNSTTAEDLSIIWATNDTSINDKTQDYSLTYGTSKINDSQILEIATKLSKIDIEIPDDIKELSQQIDELTKQANQAYSTLNSDEIESVEYITNTVADLRNKLDSRLLEVSQVNSGSVPGFNVSKLDFSKTDYLFYRPVLYRRGSSGNYVHAIIFIELSTQSLIDAVRAETIRIVQSVLIVAVIAILLGITAAYIFAGLIIKPIKKLEKHLNMIGRTKNKAELKDKDVEIKSKDEIGRLGTAVNNMTHQLVKVAEEEVLTLDGKAVQNAFLPLIEKTTIAKYDDSKIQCFGYYEGESGVSGDYFDYRKLDDQWYVTIKCDASGHGVPAAIIMTVVATLFREYFNTWSFKKNGTQLNKLIEQVNDSIESLGLKGKFATMIICLINQQTGELYMCNAGDTLVHIFDSAEMKMKTLTLANAPTAGVFSSDLIAMRGGFKVEKGMLKHGDVLFLYTDGIEESTRRIRDPEYTVKQEEVQIKKMNPKTHQEEVEIKQEDSKEEFGPERVSQIIECVMNRKKFILTKVDNPRADEILEFDFTTCQGTIDEAVIALAACEKVFRFYKPENLGNTEYIKIDKKIDEFLQTHFNGYDMYAAGKVENPDTPNYFDYEKLLEDEQSDDLTLLAVRRV